jgi:hypothetical protein
MKIAILILVLIVVVFVVATVAGNHDQGADLSKPAWITSLSGSLERKVAASDITAPCFQPALKEFKVVAPAGCMATIGVAKDKYRKLVLEPLGTGVMALHYQAPADDGSSLGTQDSTLSSSQNASDQSKSLVILSSGGQLRLTCSIGGQCVAILQ